MKRNRKRTSIDGDKRSKRWGTSTGSLITPSTCVIVSMDRGGNCGSLAASEGWGTCCSLESSGIWAFFYKESTRFVNRCMVEWVFSLYIWENFPSTKKKAWKKPYRCIYYFNINTVLVIQSENWILKKSMNIKQVQYTIITLISNLKSQKNFLFVVLVFF